MRRTFDDPVRGRIGGFLAETGSSAPGASRAVSEAMRLLSIDPSRPEAPYLLGLVAESRGDRLAAQKFYRAALALDPTFGPARERLRRSVRRDDDELGALLLGAHAIRSGEHARRLSRTESER